MRSRFRHSLVLTILLALVLGVSGTAAPIEPAGDLTNTTFAGIDVDATTIPELQTLMNAHRINAVQLTNFYLGRIHQLNPTLKAVITVSGTALAEAQSEAEARAATLNAARARS